MGSKLSVLAAVQLIAFATAGVAHAEVNKKQLARELFELGIEEYKAEQWDAAATTMDKSYALDPQPNALYALAQSERLGGKCKKAVPHYQKLLETSNDKQIIGAVKQNLELCRQIEAGEEPKIDSKKDAAALERQNAPILQIRTVYRTEEKTNKVAIVLFTSGGVAISGAVAMYFIGVSARNDADRATTLDEYNDLYDRSKRFKLMSYGAAGLGVGLITFATVRVMTGGKKRSSEVALVPTSGGSMISWAGSW